MRWVQAGATGWGWSEMLPAYEAVEREIPILTYPEDAWLPFQRTFVRACVQLGFRRHDRFNEPDAWDGIAGAWPRNRRNEIRQGSLVTYIRAARGRANFEIRDRAIVDRVLHDGRRATGVTYVDAGGRRADVHADRVVLAAGAYGSPPILLRSGIGPAQELSAHGSNARSTCRSAAGCWSTPAFAGRSRSAAIRPGSDGRRSRRLRAGTDGGRSPELSIRRRGGCRSQHSSGCSTGPMAALRFAQPRPTTHR